MYTTGGGEGVCTLLVVVKVCVHYTTDGGEGVHTTVGSEFF